MCGILGSVNREFNSEALQLIAHRGPNDEGLELLRVGSHQICLGHKRLSIIDLSEAGHQPMFLGNKEHVIIYNGEIYNHNELRKLLQGDFRGTSDTETVLTLLAEYGINAVSKLNGIFAFGYVNTAKKKLYLVRDPYGVKPLYYSVNKNEILFGSELKPLIQLSDRTELDRDSLALLLRLRYTPSPRTLFKNIKKVRPGEIIEFDLSGDTIAMRAESYLQKTSAPKNISEHEALEGYEHHLEQAINRQLLSDVDVGILLSGGVDSALVAHFAQKHSSKKLRAFTIGFEGDQQENEIIEAEETAKHLGLAHYSEKISFSSYFDVLRKVVGIIEEPIATGSVIPMYYLSKLASEHVSVVLTGQGADEPLGGYNKYKGELWYDKIPSLFHPFIHLLGPMANKSTLKRAAKLFGERDELNRFIKSAEVFSPAQIQNLTGFTSNGQARNLYEYMSDATLTGSEAAVQKMMILDTHMNLSDDLLMYTDKITMHFSIEARVPMLDKELVRYINSLPCELKVSTKKGKIIHKKVAQQVLPPSIVNRPKKGFMTPVDQWFLREEDTFRDIFLSGSTEFSNWFDRKELEKIVKNFPDRNQIYDKRHIFLLASIAIWMESYLKPIKT